MCEGGRPEALAPAMASGSRRRQGPSGGLAGADAASGGGGGRRPRGWRTVAFVVGVFAAIYMSTNAFSFSLTFYLYDRYHMLPNAATNLNNVFTGTFNFSPVIGAFVADALWGRFRTLLFGTVVGVVGMVVITLSASLHQLKPAPCSPLDQQAGTCPGPTSLQRAVLYIGMGLLVVSAGGTNPTSLPFGADQFDESNERHKAGLERFYNWYYAIATLATFLALTVLVYVQMKVSWGLGFAIPTVLMAVALAVFLAGAAVYVYVPPEGSIFSSVARVFVASFRKWRLRLPHPDDARRQEEALYTGPPVTSTRGRVHRLPLTLQLSFLNKAAIVTEADEVRPDGSPARPWSLCSVQQVEEAKCLVKIIPVWISGTLWFTAVAELTNYTLIQAITMDLHIGKHFSIPEVSIIAVFYLAVALTVPVYDLLIARAARGVTKGGRGITLLQRQGAGLVIGALAFVVAAAVERRRRRSALESGVGTTSLSVFLLAPQLAVMGVSGAFSLVGQTEFYNTQFPDQMRTLANAAFYCAQGVSSYLATLVVNIVNARTRGGSTPGGWVPDDINAGRIDNFYYVMAVLTAANFVYFLVCAHFYQYKDEQAADSPATDRLEPEPAEGSSGRTSDSDAALLMKT
ncbi:hypothetical protein HU200_057877 [Digitaria exilis]|uniref:Uncharacterized protein n=1 Tax=Digitaria exilis TaxID=1010633 RepID=A0A835DZM6_9POAL|nr:hypothetical protein HU200_057877 [Digitaria exilis]